MLDDRLSPLVYTGSKITCLGWFTTRRAAMRAGELYVRQRS
jgi:hypothetical protein